MGEVYISVNPAKHLDEIAAIEAASYPPDEAASRNGIAFRMKVAPEFWMVAEKDGKVWYQVTLKDDRQ